MTNYHRSSSILSTAHQQLFESTKSNNIKEIKYLILNNPGLLTEEYDNGLCILELACYELADKVQPGTIKVLMDIGADPNRVFEEWDYKSALHFAAMGQNSEIIATIASHPKVDVNATAESRNALLIIINDCEQKKETLLCVEELWRRGIDLHYSDNNKNTALYFAAKKKQTDIVDFILSKDNTVTSKEAELLKKMGQAASSFVVDDNARNKSGMDYLKFRDENGFINWYNNNEGDVDDSSEISYLQFASERHLLKTVEFLLQKNPNKVGSRNQKHPLIIAVENGYHQIVEEFLKTDNVEIPHEVLNAALKRVDWDGGSNGDYLKTLQLILGISGIDVNTKDPINGNYPLHYAIKYAGNKIISQLLEKKASLANRDGLNYLAVTDIEHDTLQDHFDSCLEAHPEDPKSENREGMYLTFDYTTLLPTDYGNVSPTADYEEQGQKPLALVKENDVILYMSNSRELRPLLHHPLIVSFLYVKWHRVKFLFYANLLIYLLFCLSLGWFIAKNYNKTGVVQVDVCYILLFSATVIITIRELFQCMTTGWEYIQKAENYVEVALLIDVFLMLFTASTDEERRPCFAFAILLTAIELVFLFGSVPGMSTYIVMLRTVAFNFIKFLLFSAILIIAFALSFYTLFRKVEDEAENTAKQNGDDENPGNKTEPFSNIYLAMVKTLVMMTGEFEAGDLDFDQFPISSHIIFIIFVVLIALILLNLLNGLAVSDTQEILNEAKLVALITRAQYISYIESMVFENVLRVRNKGFLGGCLDKWSRWWLARVCITPRLQQQNMLVVFPNQQGRISWSGRKIQNFCSCCNQQTIFHTFVCQGDKLEESIIKMARSIITERKTRDGSEGCDQCKKLLKILGDLIKAKKQNSFDEQLINF